MVVLPSRRFGSGRALARRAAVAGTVAALAAGVLSGVPGPAAAASGDTGAASAFTVRVTGSVDVPVESVTALALPGKAVVPADKLLTIARFVKGGNGDPTGRTFALDLPADTPVRLRLRTAAAGYVPDLYLGAGRRTSPAYPIVEPVVYTADTALGSIGLRRTGAATVTLVGGRKADQVSLERRNGLDVRVDADGAGTFRGLIPGRYVATADADNGTLKARAEVLVKPGATASVRLRYPTAAAIVGRVTTSSGKGIKNVRVDAAGARGYVRAVTDANGRFRLTRLAAGTYTLDFTGRPGTKAAGYVRVLGRTVRVEAGRIAHPRVKLARGGTVAVRVAGGGDSTGVWVQNATGEKAATVTRKGTRYVVTGVPAGTYTLVAQRTTSGRYATTRVRVRAGKVVRPATLRPSRTAKTLVVKVAGVTKATDGVVLVGMRQGGLLDWPRYGTAWSKGRFVVPHVVPGRWYAQVQLTTATRLRTRYKPAVITMSTRKTTVTVAVPTTAVRRTGSVGLGGRPVHGALVGSDSVYLTVVSEAAGRPSAASVASVEPSDARGVFSFWWSAEKRAQRLVVDDFGILPETGPYYLAPNPATVRTATQLKGLKLAVAGG